MLHPWGLLKRLTHFDKKNWTDWQVNWLTEAAPTMIEDETMNREMHDNDSENYANLIVTLDVGFQDVQYNSMHAASACSNIQLIMKLEQAWPSSKTETIDFNVKILYKKNINI